MGGTSQYDEAERRFAERLLAEHYDELVRIARSKRRRAGMADTSATLDLMHEAFARLGGRSDFTSSNHFLRACMLAMRHVVIDYARRKVAAKRGGGQADVPFHEAEPFLPEFSETPEQLVGIAELLDDLRAENARWLEVVDARYFSGLTEAEAALALGVSERTVRRDWQAARRWLANRLQSG